MMGILLALATLLATGAVAAGWRAERGSGTIAAAGVLVGSAFAAAPALSALAGTPPAPVAWRWPLPFGAFALGMDPLSAWFVLALAALAPPAAVFGVGYLRGSPHPRRARVSWLGFNALIASMFLTLTARNGVLFLLAWEGMALSSFALVVYDYERDAARDAGWIYLVASHLGAAFLLAFFALLGRGTTMDFAAFPPPAAGGLLFALALIGFGTKAGFVPLHVWLPEAHPAAPSHVSALMSGAMIKMGVYGLFRALGFLGAPQEGWGWALVGIGAISGVLGVLFASAQRDLKRALAYSSVENLGIIALGMGIGLIGSAHGMTAVAALGYAGALLHALNHALFKGLLFLGAGAVRHGAGTLEIERLGGLLKRMPSTGAAFLVGAAAICGLPPFNGFVGEFFIYLASFRAALGNSTTALGAGMTTIVALSLIGGLAAVCFARAGGLVFLGAPRTKEAERAREAEAVMRGPMAFLAAACVVLGLGAPLGFLAVTPVVMSLPFAPADAAQALDSASRPALGIALGGGVLAALTFAAWGACRRLLRGRETTRGMTWDCGYAAPTARMQYTASSFAAPLMSVFAPFLRFAPRRPRLEKLFPGPSEFHGGVSDLFRRRLFEPLFRRVDQIAGRVRGLQHGRTQFYVLYVALTALILLVWKLR